MRGKEEERAAENGRPEGDEGRREEADRIPGGAAGRRRQPPQRLRHQDHHRRRLRRQEQGARGDAAGCDRRHRRRSARDRRRLDAQRQAGAEERKLHEIDEDEGARRSGQDREVEERRDQPAGDRHRERHALSHLVRPVEPRRYFTA